VSDGAKRRVGDAGWLHRLRDDPAWQARRSSMPRKTRDERKVHRDFRELAQRATTSISAADLRWLSDRLGLSEGSLRELEVGMLGDVFTFPMQDEMGAIIGIRTRRRDGTKACVPGSHNGLFCPGAVFLRDPLVICEGPTDTAAAMDLGFCAIGRPNCNARARMTANLVGHFRPGRIVIFAQRDKINELTGEAPGLAGAQELARVLAHPRRRVRIIMPPEGIKDVRQWLRAGATRADVEALIDAAEPIVAPPAACYRRLRALMEVES
jgi:phage/plasmid primase-like uncharacterized protein